jgi:transcriptional regulator with XRE-family HTH domain
MDRYTKLKPHRKRRGFTQEELAFLLGDRKHSAISRYEAGDRKPDLKTAVAFKVLFESDLRELFPGVHAQVCGEIAERARLLSEQIRSQEGGRRADYKLKMLSRLQREGLDGVI